MNIINLSQLPAPAVIEILDYEQILSERKAAFLALVPEDKRDQVANTLEYESEPITILLQESAYRELAYRNRINEVAKSLLLAYATGTDLDQIGALFNVTRLTGESDDRLRSRVQQGFSALGAAGPSQAYRAHAMGVSADIVDVSVASSAAGRVDVCVLAHQTVAADAATDSEKAIGAVLFADVTKAENEAVIVARNDSALLNAVITALSDENVRPLTDQVFVFAPHVVQASITARLHVYRGPDPSTVLADAQASLAAYLNSIRLLGYDMTRAGIIGALAVPGVQNVLLDSPISDIPCAVNQVAIASSIDITVERVTQ